MKAPDNFFPFLLLNILNFGRGKTSEEEISLIDRFDFVRKEPANAIGIFTTVIAQAYRKANKTEDEFSINRDFMHREYFHALIQRCKDSDHQDGSFAWTNCASNDKGLFAIVHGGVPEPKNKTVTYLEVTSKPFEKMDENGKKVICILDEFYSSKVYFVMKTYSHEPSNDTFPRGYAESVDATHQHQLDSFGEHFLSLFGDNIDMEAIYNFGENEYYERDPPYECLLSIGSSQNPKIIEEKCDFYCPELGQVPPDMMEQVLIQAREKAYEEQKKEERDSHIEL